MGKLDMGELFMTFLLIVIALSLTPTVSESVIGVTGTGGNNLTGAAATLAGLITLAWVIMILAIGFAAVWVQFRGMRTT